MWHCSVGFPSSVPGLHSEIRHTKTSKHASFSPKARLSLIWGCRYPAKPGPGHGACCALPHLERAASCSEYPTLCGQHTACDGVKYSASPGIVDTQATSSLQATIGRTADAARHPIANPNENAARSVDQDHVQTCQSCDCANETHRHPTSVSEAWHESNGDHSVWLRAVPAQNCHVEHGTGCAFNWVGNFPRPRRAGNVCLHCFEMRLPTHRHGAQVCLSPIALSTCCKLTAMVL